MNENLENFTISIWIQADHDVLAFASAFATGNDTTKNKFLISDIRSSGIIAITKNKTQWLEIGSVAQNN